MYICKCILFKIIFEMSFDKDSRFCPRGHGWPSPFRRCNSPSRGSSLGLQETYHDRGFEFQIRPDYVTRCVGTVPMLVGFTKPVTLHHLRFTSSCRLTLTRRQITEVLFKAEITTLTHSLTFNSLTHSLYYVNRAGGLTHENPSRGTADVVYTSMC